MKSLTLILSVVALVSAQSNPPLPPACALTCIASANTGSCSATDNGCLCRNEAFIKSTTDCIQKACTKPEDLAAALASAQALCAAAGVTLTSSGGTAPTGTTPAGSSTSSSATGTITVPPSTSSPTTSNSGASHNIAGLSGVVGVAAALFMAL